MRVRYPIALLCALASPIAVLLFPTVSPAEPPLPCATIPKVLVLTPDGSIPFTATIGGCDGWLPAEGSIVQVEFSPEADALIAWAPGQEHPILNGRTDANGQVTFHVAGAGCVDPDRFTGPGPVFIVRFLVDDILFAELYATSPDVVNEEGLLPTQLGTNLCENGISLVDLSDAVFHTRAIKLGLVEPCSKLTGDPADPVNLDDAVVLTPFVKLGPKFTCQ